MSGSPLPPFEFSEALDQIRHMLVDDDHGEHEH